MLYGLRACRSRVAAAGGTKGRGFLLAPTARLAQRRSEPLSYRPLTTRPAAPTTLDKAPAFAYGPPERAYPIRKKPDFVPAVQRWSALLPEDELVVGVYGVQSKEADDIGSSPLLPWIDNLTQHEDGPAIHDHARFTDSEGYLNHVITVYWTSPTRYDAWRSSAAGEEWWASPERLTEPGIWREIMRVPADRVETIYWVDYPRALCFAPGVAMYPTPYAGYYGAMEDRLYSSANDGLASNATMKSVVRTSEGARWRVRPPHNFAVIRSAHTWGLMDDEQLADYNRKLLPSLEKGMDFLTKNPESGCASLRWQVTTDSKGAEEAEKHATAHFLSLKHMENWSEGHRTHAAIFHAALSRYKHYGADNQLRTWHEVFVLPEDREQVFEYINCHEGTGILRYFDAEKL